MKIIEAIGRTPLVEISTEVEHPDVRLYGKLEGNNPAGSVKDRPARAMILGAEAQGVLKPGVRLIEPTSGNTGIALAMVAAARGYALELVMPDNATAERARTMRAYGADVILTPAALGMEGAIEYARGKVAGGGYLMLDQFSNPDCWRAHYATTGPEIWADTSGGISHFVSAMGTTGTIMGVSRFLKEQARPSQIIGCQPAEGSQIAGIRRWAAEYVPLIFEPARVDRIIEVSEADAVDTARSLAREQGIFAGASSGGAVWVARQICRELNAAGQAGLVVCILCDRGDRYISSSLYAVESGAGTSVSRY